MMTGHSEENLSARLVAQGAAACLLKPFELDEFREVMGALLASHRTPEIGPPQRNERL